MRMKDVVPGVQLGGDLGLKTYQDPFVPGDFLYVFENINCIAISAPMRGEDAARYILAHLALNAEGGPVWMARADASGFTEGRYVWEVVHTSPGSRPPRIGAFAASNFLNGLATPAVMRGA